MQITRRGFLKGAVFSGTAAAAAAVGVTVPGTALAAADEAASAPSTNPYLDLYDGGVSYLPVREVGEKPTFRNGKVAFEDRDLCQDFGHVSSRNQAAIGMASGLGSVLSKKAAMASAGTL